MQSEKSGDPAGDWLGTNPLNKPPARAPKAGGSPAPRAVGHSVPRRPAVDGWAQACELAFALAAVLSVIGGIVMGVVAAKETVPGFLTDETT